MDDNLIEEFMPHKKGDLLEIIGREPGEFNQWKIHQYLIGGYELINLHSGEYKSVMTEEVGYAMPNLKKIYGHEGHEVIVSYVAHPEHDRYLYCRDCKKEIKTRYQKLPPPTQVYFYE